MWRVSESSLNLGTICRKRYIKPSLVNLEVLPFCTYKLAAAVLPLLSAEFLLLKQNGYLSVKSWKYCGCEMAGIWFFTKCCTVRCIVRVKDPAISPVFCPFPLNGISQTFSDFHIKGVNILGGGISMACCSLVTCFSW
jgi:hypothetical protein